MLTNLKIQNVAIIENLDVEFLKGFNALTGETGAGKSILFDSLGFVLGNRADRTLIRSGEDRAKVSAVFDITNNDPVKKELKKYEIDSMNELIITRTMTLEGKNTILINGEHTTLGVLKEISKYLVDIYGQNEHQILLDPLKQLELLDSFGKSDILTLKNDYLQNLVALRKLKNELNSLGGSEEERLKEIDYLNYQIDELKKANISVSEEEELLQKKNILHNAEKISLGLTHSQTAMDICLTNVKIAQQELSHIEKYDERISSLLEQLKSAQIELSDVSETINTNLNQGFFDEEEFNRVDERLDVYSAIKRKHGKTTEQILQNLKVLEDRLETLYNVSERRTQINKIIEDVLGKLNLSSDLLTKKRKEVALNLEYKICEELKCLGIKNAKIKFEFTPLTDFEERGGCDVELLFSANLGEPLKPLKAIISGGELSRFMLALKVVAGNIDKMPTMIFDEIDTGISGQMSEIMAQKLYEVSLNHQVLTITHSAQIASMSDNHYLIEKKEENGKTISVVKKLTTEEKIVEIAKFMAGNSNLIYALQSARALLEEQVLFKQKFIK